MYHHLNTLYVMLEGAHLRLDCETVRIEHEDAPFQRVPLHHLGAIVVFGNISITPPLIHRCAECGISIVWLSTYGRFKARLEGAVSGSVLLRRAQHESLSNPQAVLRVARNIAAGKLQNLYCLLMRAARTLKLSQLEDAIPLYRTAQTIQEGLHQLPSARAVDEVRGIEGRATRAFYATFDRMIRHPAPLFRFEGRTRRPPRNRVNALLCLSVYPDPNRL